jgi:ribosome maturation factor RimP
MAKAAGTAQLEAKCIPEAARLGYELVDVCLDREPSGKYLRFYIDKPEGVSLDDCEAFHKAVRSLTDSVDYDYMEVSSPGIDRPLKKERDFDRNLGNKIEVRLFKPINGNKIISGRLAGLEDGDILVDTIDGIFRLPRKEAALVKPVIDMEGIEDVDIYSDDEMDTEDI